MNLSIKQLRAFLILSENSSFTESAKKFNLSQPAFSSVIANLENEIGYRLFDRGTRQVSLNADGIHFVDIARRLVQYNDEAISEIKTRALGNQGTIVLAVLPSLAVEWLPDILAKYHGLNNQSSLQIFDTQWDKCLKALLDGQANLAITAGLPPSSLFDSTFLFSDKFFLICHQSHPLAKKEDVEFSEIQNYPVLGFISGTSIRQYVNQLTLNLGVTLNYVMEVRQLTTMMGLVAANYGISIVTELTLFQFRKSNIAIVPFKDISIERAIYLVKQKDRILPNHVLNFQNFVIEQAEKTAR